MKGTVHGKDLAQALDATRAVVGTKQSLPILGAVRLELGADRLVVEATDLEQAITLRVPAMMDTPGTIAVPALKMAQVAHELTAGPVAFEVRTGPTLVLAGASAKFRIPGMDANDFPGVKTQAEGQPIGVAPERLLDAIRRTAYATSRDESRYALTALEWHAVGSELRVTASDGHRLTRLTLPVEANLTVSKTLLVPRTAAKALETLLKNRTTPCTLHLNETTVAVVVGEAEAVYTVRLVEGVYPNVTAILEGLAAHPVTMTLEVKAFATAVRRVAVMATGEAKPLKLTARPDTLTLEAASPDAGEAEAVLAVETTAEHVDVGVNARYLLDYLDGLDGGTVELGLKDRQSALRFGGADGQYYVVMPLRIS
jgi:DNA polymerase-3 subunit beta